MKVLVIHFAAFMVLAFGSAMLLKPFFRHPESFSHPLSLILLILTKNKRSPATLPALVVCMPLSIELFLRIAIYAVYIWRIRFASHGRLLRRQNTNASAGRKMLPGLVRGLYILSVLVVSFFILVLAYSLAESSGDGVGIVLL